MSTFKAALRVVAAHPLYLTIYALVISLMGAVIVLTSSASSSSETAEYEPCAVEVAIVDRDGSPLSQAFARHMGDLYALVDVADEPRAPGCHCDWPGGLCLRRARGLWGRAHPCRSRRG